MWLRLNLEGIDFHFRISKYRQTTRENWYDEWCEIDLTLQASKWLDYQIISDEIMLAIEVERLRDKIDALLHDKLSDPEIYECIEPDFAFHLNPKADIRNNPSIIYVKPGNENVDINMDFQVSFWDRDGGLSSNRLLLSFGRENLERFLCYLQYITRVVDDENETVQRLLSEGNLYG